MTITSEVKRFLIGGVAIAIGLAPSLTQAQAQAECKLIENINGVTPTANSKTLQQFNWLAINDGKVISTGTQKPTKHLENCTKVDGKNHYLLPGLIDAHGHVSGLGKEKLRVNLRGTSSEAEAVNRVKQFSQANPHSQWILGRGWNQVLWLNKTFPHKKSLDKIEANRPILLRRIDGHAAWANSKALALAGITHLTPDPKGGKIVRDNNGEATGVLIDNAIDLVGQHIKPLSSIELSHAFDKAFNHLLSVGITSVHDAGVGQADLNYYLQAQKQQPLPVRIYGMLSGASQHLKQWLDSGVIKSSDDRLLIQSVKLYSDGALGSRGAALLKPYSDDADNSGLLVTEPKTLNNLIELILSKGFQANVHAIGDRGNQNVLNAFDKAYKNVGGKHLRNRIEHAQVVSLNDIPRFKTLDIIASMQPVHATSDMNMAEDRVGSDRIKGAYAWRKFLNQGTIIASGSDFPVELANPFHGIHAAVTRQNHQNQPNKGWIIEEALTPTEALRSFTLDAAFAAHQENIIGSLEKGKWADFILVDKDIISGNPQEIWQTQVLETWVAGEKVFSKK